MIRFVQVSKQYGERTKALANISVEISDGEFVFLIGPSGAGKTTFLRLITRDVLPTQGEVFVDDWKINILKASKIYQLRRKVATVFQDFKLLPDRTIYENVALGLEILGKGEKAIHKDVTDVLELVGLSDKSTMFPLQLSAGELQRTSIARAIVGGPTILLADEPTGNLDPDTADEILSILQEVNKIGTTIIMATHNATIVNEMKKRTITLSQGEIVNDELKGRYHIPKKQHKFREAKSEKQVPEE